MLTGEQTATVFPWKTWSQKKGYSTIADAYGRCADFCQSKRMPVDLHRNEFRGPTVLAVRSTWGMGLSKDLVISGKYTSGWRNLDARVVAA